MYIIKAVGHGVIFQAIDCLDDRELPNPHGNLATGIQLLSCVNEN